MWRLCCLLSQLNASCRRTEDTSPRKLIKYCEQVTDLATNAKLICQLFRNKFELAKHA